jgi:hypothetical protein
MTEPAPDSAETVVFPIISTTRQLSLGTTALFCALERCDGPHGAGFIPMVLPSVANEATSASFSVGPAKLLEDVTTDAIVTLLVAARHGRLDQIGGDRTFLPPGFAHNATRVMYGSESVSRDLLTPLMKLFSSNRDWNNLMARSATLDDFNSLSSHLQVVVPEFRESSNTVITQALSLVVLAMDRVVHHCPQDDPDFHLGGYERLFKTVMLGCCPDFIIDNHITGRHLNDMKNLSTGSQREACYWLALNQLLPIITPVFLSPVHLPSRWLLAIMQHGALVESGCFQGDIPILLQGNEAKLPPQCHVSTTLYEPNPSWDRFVQSQTQEERSVDSDSSNEDDDDDKGIQSRNGKPMDPALSECVRVLCQRSSVLPSVMQSFGMPGIDLQMYVSSLCRLFFLLMFNAHDSL